MHLAWQSHCYVFLCDSLVHTLNDRDLTSNKGTYYLLNYDDYICQLSCRLIRLLPQANEITIKNDVCSLNGLWSSVLIFIEKSSSAMKPIMNKIVEFGTTLIQH